MRTVRRSLFAAAGLVMYAAGVTPAGVDLLTTPKVPAVAASEHAAAGTINNGTEDTGPAFPYVVRLQGPGGSCSGIMITPRWVLTAAHCLWGHTGATGCGDPEGVIVEPKAGWIPSGWPASPITVVSPQLNPPPVVDGAESIGGTLDGCAENARSLDWALLHLNRRVAYSETNRFHPPIVLGAPTCNLDDEFRGVIVGFGPTSVFGGGSGVRHFGFEDDWEREATDTGAEYRSEWFIPVPGVTPETTIASFLAFLDPVYDGMNKGDSGGPLLQVNELDQPIALCGVASSPFVDLVLPAIGVEISNSYAAVDAEQAWQFIESRIVASFPENPDLDGWYEGECRPPNESADADGDSDGIPDACDNCALVSNADQTNFDLQTDAIGDACDDSDGDGLVDGDELKVHLTDPLDPDTDDDGLSDGDEINVHGTDPLDPDSDNDELNDGLEVGHDSDPLNPDTDGDGIPDGEDVEFLKNGVSTLPASVFTPPGLGLQTAIQAQLDAIESLLLDGKTEEAIRALMRLRRHVDGCGTVPDPNDWIETCPEQTAIRALIDLLIANLSN